MTVPACRQIRREKENEETKSVVIRVMNKEAGHNVVRVSFCRVVN